MRTRAGLMLVAGVGLLVYAVYAHAEPAPPAKNGKCRIAPQHIVQGGPEDSDCFAIPAGEVTKDSACYTAPFVGKCAATVWESRIPGSCATTDDQYCDDSKTGTPGGVWTSITYYEWSFECILSYKEYFNKWYCKCEWTKTGAEDTKDVADVYSGGIYPDCTK